MQKILGRIRRAVQDFNMIEEGDIIAVGVSGGKDSVTLLYGLHLLKNFYPKKFEVMGLMLTLGYDNFDPKPVENFCREKEIPFFIKETEIKKIVFDYRKEENPCSLCANLRRGALNNFAKEKGCNKVALAHHYDDLIDTFIMNLFYNGRLHTFEPVSFLDRSKITVIRPMIYVKEKDIRSEVKKNNLPVVKNPCPVEGHTTRHYIRSLIIDLKKEIPEIDKRIFTAIKKDIFHFEE
ncbi:ATP-binding protein [Thermoanaerobacter mathranii]|uniref:ATP-binding protein n=1 Tax=Thermoanaerobacter mathranii TaxID=583357 RepID=UPI003AAE100D